MLVVVPDT